MCPICLRDGRVRVPSGEETKNLSLGLERLPQAGEWFRTALRPRWSRRQVPQGWRLRKPMEPATRARVWPVPRLGWVPSNQRHPGDSRQDGEELALAVPGCPHCPAVPRSGQRPWALCLARKLSVTTVPECPGSRGPETSPSLLGAWQGDPEHPSPVSWGSAALW